MIGVAVAAVLGPASAVYVLGPVAAVLLLAVGLMLGVTLGAGVRPGVFSPADYVTALLISILVSLYLALFVYMTLWKKVEAYFSTTPWLRHNGKLQASEGGRLYATRCPFTGHRPTMRCPSCTAHVHDNAFHRADRFVTLPLGETVLRWDAAKLATEQLDDMHKARQLLDSLLDFKGNTLTCSITDCCVGCAVWQKSFNLLPRLSIRFALQAVFFAFLPWALTSVLDGESEGAKGVHVLSSVLGVVFSGAALLVQVQALLRAEEFLEKYRPVIPSLRPVLRLPGWHLLRHVIRPPWERVL